jgi:hypothetical protein
MVGKRTMSGERTWQGIIPVMRRVLFGGARQPKARRIGEAGTPTTSDYYAGMNEDYRWFRQDELIRKCIVTNAYFATLAAGFTTVIEPSGEDVKVDDFAYVKGKIDEYNRRVNLDQALFVAQVKRSIYGRAGFELVVNGDETPALLLSLQSTRLRPRLNSSWELEAYRYEGRQDFYNPDEVIYFTNLSLEADHEGLSDVEPVRSICRARHSLLREDFPEIARSLWAPYVLLEADTSGLSLEEAEKVVDELAGVARAGKSIAVNESVKPTVIDISPDIEGLSRLLSHLEQAIVGNFGTPRFLLGRPIENRATAYAELEAYVQGTIASSQRYLKREIERQWYDRWTAKALSDEGVKIPDGEDLPVRIKHRWNPVVASDIYEMAKAVAILWGGGSGPIGGKPEKAWEMMGWDPAELEGS